MTTRSWSRLDYDYTVNNFNRVVGRDIYSQAGANTPRAMRELGLLRENVYIAERTQISDKGISYKTTINPTPKRLQPSVFGATPYFEPITSPDPGLAIAKLLGKWRRSEFELGVTIGEGRESAQMIVERLAKLASSVRALRHGDIRGAVGFLASVPKGASKRAQLAATAKDFSSSFLELELGWKPLIRDIYSLADHIKVKPRKNVIRTSVKTSGGVFPQPSGSFPASGIYGRNQVSLHLKVETFSQPSEIERLGLTDPLSIAWNLTGASFVADWFLPIGNTLSMWHALQAMLVTNCVESKFTEKVGFGRVNAGTLYLGSYIPLQSGQYTIDYFKLERKVSTNPFALWGVLARTPEKVRPVMDPTFRKMGILSALVHQRILRL